MKMMRTEYDIKKDMVTITQVTKKLTGETFLPSVIEPSFGIGRIIYSILEHSYAGRPDDAQRGVSVLPLTTNEQLVGFIPKITSLLTSHGLSHKVDSTGQSIGRRYARTDEIGIPFGITIDFETLSNNTVTLRERDSTNQIRVSIAELPALLDQLCNGYMSWAQVWADPKYPHVEASKE